MRVVHLSRGRDWRGGERQVRLLVGTLDERGGLTQLVATGRGTHLGTALREEHRDVLELPWHAAYDPRALYALLGHLRDAGGTTGELILHAHDSHALALGLAASKLLGRPLVATRRSVTLPGRLWRYPDRVIAISTAVEQALLGRGVAAARIARIPSGIALTAPGDTYPERKSDTSLVIAVGALTPEKGHVTLVEAFGKLAPRFPAARLLILGEGIERSVIEGRIRQLDLTARIVLAGEEPNAAAQIRHARVFVQPSLREALGTAVLEAMALGVPVVASRTGGLSELLGDDAGLLVPAGDPTALAAAIERLLLDSRLGTRLTCAARARVVDFDASGMADRVAEVYRSALGDP